ncbi:hypothetical protein VDGL01_10291 [Verticillium dahliae]
MPIITPNHQHELHPPVVERDIFVMTIPWSGQSSRGLSRKTIARARWGLLLRCLLPSFLLPRERARIIEAKHALGERQVDEPTSQPAASSQPAGQPAEVSGCRRSITATMASFRGPITNSPSARRHGDVTCASAPP